MKNLFFILLLMASSSYNCSSTRKIEDPIKSKKNLELTSSKHVNQTVSLEDLEIKQTKLWSKISELEDIVTKQKERLSLIEQKMNITDIVRDDKKTNKTIVSIKENKSKEDPKAYKKELEKGKILFKNGDYGKSFLVFSEIEKNFSQNLSQGETLYWIARCWFKLKEFQSSKKVLQSFIENFPNHPFVPTAKYFQAKADFELGLKQNAISQLKELIQEYPNNTSIKVAKNLLAQLETTP